MIRTRVGYAGGTTPNPTYLNLGDHTETFQVDYDPQLINYEDLLEVFWNSHDPTLQTSYRQYMNAVFYHDEEQKQLAEKSLEKLQAEFSLEIQTFILPLTGFTMAEDYHQKFYLQQRKDLMKEFVAVYPEFKDFINSTAAARANGELGGSTFTGENGERITDFCLPPEGNSQLPE